MSSVKVLPLGDRIIVERTEEPTVSTGGIYLPEAAKDTPQMGVVLRVGMGKLLDNGQRVPLTLKEGDKVIFGQYAGTKVKLDGKECLFMREEDVIGVAEE